MRLALCDRDSWGELQELKALVTCFVAITRTSLVVRIVPLLLSAHRFSVFLWCCLFALVLLCHTDP